MRIIHFHAENVKRLKVVDIDPDGSCVILSGANEQGKSSVLDAIEMVLGGGKGLKYTPEPVRRGEKKAAAYVHLGEPEYDAGGREVACEPNLKVTRTWTGNTATYLKVEDLKRGSTFKSAQGLLDQMVGGLAFDPLAFSLLKDQEQLATLLKLVKVPIDLVQWTANRQSIYEERTAINRRVAELDAKLRTRPELLADVPDEPVSSADILREMEEVRAANDVNEALRKRLALEKQELAGRIASCEHLTREIADIEDRLRDAKGQLQAALQSAKHRQESVSTFEDQVAAIVDLDLSVFGPRLASVEETNSLVRQKREFADMAALLESKKADSANLTAKLETLDRNRADAMKATQMPIEGLTFDDDGVRYKGIPFRQCSSEERLRVSVAIGMALNPKLRVMFVRDGSLLDSKNRATLQRMAVNNQYQLWMEITDDSGILGIVFEDGEITAVNS
jgi:hypothetical protein